MHSWYVKVVFSFVTKLLSSSNWIPVEFAPPFKNFGAFCSDLIPNDKRAYGSKQF